MKRVGQGLLTVKSPYIGCSRRGFGSNPSTWFDGRGGRGYHFESHPGQLHFGIRIPKPAKHDKTTKQAESLPCEPTLVFRPRPPPRTRDDTQLHDPPCPANGPSGVASPGQTSNTGRVMRWGRTGDWLRLRSCQGSLCPAECQPTAREGPP